MVMRFLADENVDYGIVRALRSAQHDVLSIVEIAPSTEDPDILMRSLDEERILITEDHDFCDLVFRDSLAAYGIVLVRILPTQRQLKPKRVLEVINHYGDKLIGSFISLSIDSERIRPLPG